MNFNLANVILFGVGAVLIYAAVKNESPKQVVTSAFGTSGNKAKANPKAKATQPHDVGPVTPTTYNSPYNPGYPVVSV